MKHCNRCGETRSLEEFSKSSRSKDGRQTYCKICLNAEGRKNYTDNKDRYYANAKARDRQLDNLIVQAKNKPCTDCSVKYPPYVMDFDHLSDHTKEFNISTMRRSRMAFSKILAEISKCEVVCANCHRIRTNMRNPSRYTKYEMYGDF
jgi:hypothetical protein